MPNMEQELTFMEVRLFRLAQTRWKMNRTECADIFKQHDLLGYIRDAYEEFHEQGDEANMEDIEAFLSAKGENIMAELRKESLEMAMDMVAAMGAETYARRICQPVSAVLLDFLQSNTAEMLYAKETNLWAEGPECTADEYEMEVAGTKR